MLRSLEPATGNTHQIETSTHASEQLGSPFFGKLPAELRVMIFVELFGRRRVHLDFMAHPIRADKVGNRRRWRHSLCEDKLVTPFDRLIGRPHFCLTAARRRVLDISMLFTCRRALIEGLPILYQSNVFFIINKGSRRRPVDDIRSLQAKIPKHWPLIQSLEIKWEVAAFDRNQANMVPHLWGREAYEAFWDALAEMPDLAQLRIALLMPRCSPSDLDPPSLDFRELYLAPIMRLKNLRFCEFAMPRSYGPLFGEEELQTFMESHRKGHYRILWADDAERVPSGPAVANLPHFPAAQMI
ncbi:hypothetical protein VTI74DRAFT_5174 [Chaetomium olivicolor]